MSYRPMYYMPGRKAPPEELNPYYGFEGEGRMLLGARDREEMKLLGLGEVDYSQGVPTETGTGGLGSLGIAALRGMTLGQGPATDPKTLKNANTIGLFLSGAISLGAAYYGFPLVKETWKKILFAALAVGGGARIYCGITSMGDQPDTK